MRTVAKYYLLATLIAVVSGQAVRAEERILTFVFGPGSAATARQGAHAAASAARQWLHVEGSDIEIRSAAKADPMRVGPKTPTKVFDQAFLDAALAARDSDPAAFLNVLDAGIQAAALHAGNRVIVAILNSPPLSSEAERTLENMVEFCRTHVVRVAVLDALDASTSDADSNGALASLAKRTGGAWLRQTKALEPELLSLSPAQQADSPKDAKAEKADSATAFAAENRDGGLSRDGYNIPVQTRFIRTSTTGSANQGLNAHFSDSDSNVPGGVVQTERAYESNDSRTPLRGLLIVDSPMNALKFDIDDDAGTYLARAKITAVARNSKGRAVWTGQKEITVRGAIKKLDARRQGSLLFMRGVTLPGGERYTLEAKVQDLLAGSSGSVSVPLKTGAGAPGLMASDALFVRPFKGAADKFEADQIFAYDGEAMSPVLDPVFNSKEQHDMQIYVVIYPDIHGAQPELAMELRREGKVVARVPMQFKTQVNVTATEGKFGTGAGKGSAMMGGKAREFPYLADLKNVKLPGGNYEAVISIRQGKNVIFRTVPFRMTGSSPAVVASLTGPGLQSRIPSTEDEDIVLPEIEPVKVDASGMALAPEEQKKMWDEAATNALGYVSHLPNFRCTQETHRFIAPAKTPEQLKEADSFKDELTYEDGKESYRTLELNGVKTDVSRSDLKGVHSRGEFGSMLHGVFDPEAGAAYKWAGRSMAGGVLCHVFDINVTQPKSNFALTHNKVRQQVGYTGKVFIDEESGLVRRLIIQGADVPKEFPLQQPAFALEYDMVRVGAADYLLPLRSVLQVRQAKIMVRNETTFRGYKKFDASSEIKGIEEK